jgi:hypothetical protein
MTATAILKRLQTSDDGTFGTLVVIKDGHEKTYCTGELPWRDNRSHVSCIPNGSYTCEKVHSPKFDRIMWHLDGPALGHRDGILIHWGNFCGDVSKGKSSDVLGCVLVGNKHGRISGQKVVLESKAAFADFMRFTEDVGCINLTVCGAVVPYSSPPASA